ncbi:hypothetical protein [Parachryseolinea silvisoli]|uniref:hypothetical protein n=1 Tax=Parachryseolinea silvisoli TaxID=2873601 RepID=UPI002265A551|nr:hypothetical protein [Parachryseolinea silvisoli]MCD9015627.1 hypothetical protein [Parachryseolinea silvisoli]
MGQKINNRIMSDKFINPLKEFSSKIVSISNDFPDNINSILTAHGIKLCNTRIELNKKPYWIEWNDYPDHHSFYYDFDNNEETVRAYFRNSKLRNYEYVIMDFGYQLPLSKIPIDIFINYWYELVIIAGYESVVVTEDGKLFMEFIRLGYDLKSNFPIKEAS